MLLQHSAPPSIENFIAQVYQKGTRRKFCALTKTLLPYIIPAQKEYKPAESLFS